MDIVYTHNFYSFNPKVEDKQKYIDAYEEIEFNGWGVVSSGAENPGIINGYSLKIFDYFLFTYFKDYTQYVPIQHQSSICQSVLNNQNDLDPANLLEFIGYLGEFLQVHFPNNEFYYDIEVVENSMLNGSPIRTLFENKQVIISTGHTTFTDLTYAQAKYKEYLISHKHQACIRFYNSSQSKWEEDWLDIEDGKQLKTENKTLVFKKIYLGSRLKYTLEHLVKMCQLAIEFSLKIKRNTDWI